MDNIENRENSYDVTDEIVCQKTNEIANLCLSTKYSDVTICIGKERLPAHRLVLMANSGFFCNFLPDDTSEQNKAIVMLHGNIAALKRVLR